MTELCHHPGLRARMEQMLRQRARGGEGLGFNADMHEEAVVAAILADPAIRAALATPALLDVERNEWLAQLVKAERENHCGDAACMTRRVAAAVRVLTGGKQHQDYCWAIEAFEAELGVREPALVGPEPSNAMLDAALDVERGG